MIPLWQNFKYVLEHDDRMEPTDHINLIELQAFLLGVHHHNEMERLAQLKQMQQLEPMAETEDGAADFNVSMVADSIDLASFQYLLRRLRMYIDGSLSDDGKPETAAIESCTHLLRELVRTICLCVFDNDSFEDGCIEKHM